jgi:hypothetical protein
VPAPAAFQPRPLTQPRPAADADQPSEPVDAPEPAEESPAEARPNTGVREVPVIPRPFDGVPQGEAPAAPPATPGNPFGMPFGTTSRPGVITPVPQQPGPNARPNQEP